MRPTQAVIVEAFETEESATVVWVELDGFEVCMQFNRGSLLDRKLHYRYAEVVIDGHLRWDDGDEVIVDTVGSADLNPNADRSGRVALVCEHLDGWERSGSTPSTLRMTRPDGSYDDVPRGAPAKTPLPGWTRRDDLIGARLTLPAETPGRHETPIVRRVLRNTEGRPIYADRVVDGTYVDVTDGGELR